jgi:hypothetical protein
VDIDLELAKASFLIAHADDAFQQYPQGSVQRVAWENLKAHVAAWRNQQFAPDPTLRIAQVHSLRKQFDDVKALLAEAGLIGR